MSSGGRINQIFISASFGINLYFHIWACWPNIIRHISTLNKRRVTIFLAFVTCEELGSYWPRHGHLSEVFSHFVRFDNEGLKKMKSEQNSILWETGILDKSGEKKRTFEFRIKTWTELYKFGNEYLRKTIKNVQHSATSFRFVIIHLKHYLKYLCGQI